MNRKEIGEKIKSLRKAKGWKSGTLATRAGLSPSYIPMLEQGTKCPTVETLDTICAALGVTLAEFFTEQKDANSDDKVSSLTASQREYLNQFINSLTF